MNIQESFVQFRDDIITWVTNNLSVRVPITRKINGKTLDKDITISASDIGAASSDSISNIKSEAIASAKSYTDGIAASTLTEAKSYADGKATSALNDAKTYADGKAASALNDAKSYTNTYADGKATSALNDAKSYADGKATSALNDAKSYTDTQIASHKHNIADVNSLQSSLDSISGKFGGLKFTYDNGTIYAQYGDDASTKKALGEIDKKLLIEALANSGLGLTQDSTAEEIYKALKSIFVGEFYDICGKFVGASVKPDTSYPDVLRTSSGGEYYSPSVAATRYVSHSKFIDFTNIDSITFTLNINFNNADDYFYNVGKVMAGLSRMKTSFDNDLGYVNISKSGGYTGDGYNIISGTSQTFTIDTTNLSGPYYLVLAVYCANANDASGTHYNTGTIGWVTDVILKYATNMQYTVLNKLFANGELADGIKVTGATISDGSINASVSSQAEDGGATPPTEEYTTVTISGIDLTDYDVLYIKSSSYTTNTDGEAYCNWGIDSATDRFYTVTLRDGYAKRTYENIIDVSAYTGVHNIVFYLYASLNPNTTYTGHACGASLGITDITLFS